ncbi:hypothetical protein BDV96DRAFT_649895 [Lophiotrema nucula]|uniref:Uncharacterized protein n=1 Tax=Lophiotrema nucula TaxID=690887 RepID=A0A6A5YW74_9PLEO|nr:hypothetical protein BDV96DRAFT_649895 [Lophiotrema nucula]
MEGPRKRHSPLEDVEYIHLDSIAAESEADKPCLESSADLDQTNINSSSESKRPRNLFYSVLRSLKLQLFFQLTRWRASTERPKVALYRNRFVAALHCLLHVPPLVGAITLIVFNISGFMIGYTPKATPMLQFAAKLHEVLMQASATSVLVSYIRARVYADHVPFGILFAPLHASSLSYLWSMDYWSSVVGPVWKQPAQTVSLLLIFAAVLITALSGPSSAIAMIPRPVISRTQYSARTEFQFPTSEASVYRPTSPLGLFPTKVGSNWNYDIYGDYLSALKSGLLPPPSDKLEWNFFLVSPFSQRQLTVSIEDESKMYPVAVAVIPSVIMENTLVYHYNWDILEPNKWHNFTYAGAIRLSAKAYSPHVSVRCAYHSFSDPPNNSTLINIPQNNGMGTINLFSFGEWASSATSYWIGESPKQLHSLIAVIPIHIPEDRPPSLYQLSDRTWADGNLTDLKVAACSIDAQWMPAQHEFGFASGVSVLKSQPIYATEGASHIKIDPYWAKGLEDSVMYLGGWEWFNWMIYLPLNSTIIEYLKSGIAPVPLEFALAAIFAHGLSNATYLGDPIECNSTVDTSTGPGSLYNTTDEADKCREFQLDKHYVPHEICPIDFKVTQNDCDSIHTVIREAGFGYDITGTPVILALTVLGLYCVFVLGHLIDVLLRGRTSNALDSPAELVTLALQSRYPEHLGHTSVGIETMATLREPVGIRVNEEERLELVFKNDAGQEGRELRKVEPNKAY